MIYKMIVAFDKNRGIGKNNELPWNIPSDLKHFSKITRGENNNAIIMGRRTWESLPKKPLLKRDNLILSSSLSIDENNAKNSLIKTFKTYEEINVFCEMQKYDVVWIIGGSQIYNIYLNPNPILSLNEIYVTLIDKNYDCDIFFPLLDKWKIKDNNLCEIVDNENNLLCVSYQTYIPKIN